MLERKFGSKMMLNVEGQSVGFVDDLLNLAVQRRASDVHIEPMQDKTRIRIRVDGMLQQLCDLPKGDQDAVVSRIKIISSMDITEKRLPQDGHLEKTIADRLVDFRISSMPTVYGEKIVIRILDKTNSYLTLNNLSFSNENLDAYRNLFANPHGIVLVTGPTGSGKSTTLYATLGELNKPEINIITLEDPVEYQLPGVNQIALNNKAGLSFASGLRAVLRQDPDIIMVGEIRDEETACIAVQAALTGHLVLSTLHTNNAVGAITRLLDMGIEPYLLASCLRGVVGQRLVRKVCYHCSEKYEASPAELACLHMTVNGSHYLVDATGCTECYGTGFNGRLAVQEVLTVNEEIRTLITRRATEEEIIAAATKNGFCGLYEDGVKKVLAGATTLGELLRVSEVEKKQ